MKHNFIIQIIGAPNSGKSTVAKIISEALSIAGMKIHGDNLQLEKEEDFAILEDKSAIINEFRDETRVEHKSEHAETKIFCNIDDKLCWYDTPNCARCARVS